MARSKKNVGEKYHSSFAVNLRKLMKDRDITQDELSKVVGKTRQTVSQYINGYSEPGYNTLSKIAVYFDVTTDFLLGLTDDPARKPAATDDLGLSAHAVKMIQTLKSCSSDDRRYMDFLSQLFENPVCDHLFHAMYMDCQANAAEIIFSSVPMDTETFSAESVQNRRNKILEIANSKKYNSVISGYLLQMLRFDKEQDELWENDYDFPYDCNFSRSIVAQITGMDVRTLFDSYLRQLGQATTLAIEKELAEEALANGND